MISLHTVQLALVHRRWSHVSGSASLSEGGSFIFVNKVPSLEFPRTQPSAWHVGEAQEIIVDWIYSVYSMCSFIRYLAIIKLPNRNVQLSLSFYNFRCHLQYSLHSHLTPVNKDEKDYFKNQKERKSNSTEMLWKKERNIYEYIRTWLSCTLVTCSVTKEPEC